MFRNFFKNRKQNHDEIFDALTAVETELCDLRDVVDIMNDMPDEKPPPPYLCARITAHTETLRARFYSAWDVILK